MSGLVATADANTVVNGLQNSPIFRSTGEVILKMHFYKTRNSKLNFVQVQGNPYTYTNSYVLMISFVSMNY